jgi:hypothetical protein
VSVHRRHDGESLGTLTDKRSLLVGEYHGAGVAARLQFSGEGHPSHAPIIPAPDTRSGEDPGPVLGQLPTRHAHGDTGRQVVCPIRIALGGLSAVLICLPLFANAPSGSASMPDTGRLTGPLATAVGDHALAIGEPTV